jgi:hypothetical protein
VIVLTNHTGNSATLFGSDLKHNNRVCIKIARAELNRTLNRDWFAGEVRPIVEFEMSHAQFAQFITGAGKGDGTPCTLTYAPERGHTSKPMPIIENIETKHATYRREISETARREVEGISDSVNELKAMVATGKVGLVKMREILHNLTRQVSNLPENLSYTVASAEDALEKATSDAKIEVEAFISTAAQRLGLEHISQLNDFSNTKTVTKND